MDEPIRYYCNDCGSITAGDIRYERMCEDPHGWCPILICPVCGSDNVEEADCCPTCGDYHKHVIGEIGCPDCREEYGYRIYEIYADMREAGADHDDAIDMFNNLIENFFDKYQ